MEGTNTVTITVADDDYAANNSVAVSEVINKDTWSYSFGTTASAGAGFTGATGDFVAKSIPALPLHYRRLPSTLHLVASLTK